MFEQPTRTKKIPNPDKKQPQTISELIRRYDLDNTKIYDYLDKFIEKLNNQIIEERKITYPVRFYICNTNRHKSVRNTKIWNLGTHKRKSTSRFR